MSNLAKLEELKIDIRSLLVSRNSKDITLPYLNKLYKDITDEDIPYKDFNYTSLKQFLASMPDILDLKTNEKNELCAYHVESEKSKHISSLVSREKTNTNPPQRRRRRNFVEPKVLNEILLELADNSPAARHGENKRIKKTDVLSCIKSRIGEYVFYDAQDLHNQLNELGHILYYTDEYIYFKHGFPRDNRAKNRTNNKIQDTHLTNGMDKPIGGFTQDNSVGDLIRSSTKERLRTLVEKYPKGISCAELPKLYQREFKLDLEYSDLGYSCIIEFVGALPDILQIVTDSNTRKHYVLDARIPVESYEHQTSDSTCENGFIENSDNVAALPPKLQSAGIIKSLKPNNVLYDETIDGIDITSVQDLDIIVCEVHHPSFFWVHPRENQKIIYRLMENLQEFYANRDISSYKIPSILVKPKVHVACLFDNIWHRGIIKKMTPEGPTVHFYDYGTNKLYNSENLYFLSKQFSVIPKQAIRCALHNVRPVGGNKWSPEVNLKFTERVFNKPFVAYVSSIDHQSSLVVDLVDTSNHLIDVDISRWMVQNKFGEWVTPVPKTIPTLNHCSEHMLKLTLGPSCNNNNQEKDTSISSLETRKNSSTNDLSFESIKSSKKLEILRKYKTKVLNNSTGLSTSMSSSQGDSSFDKESIFND